MLVKIQISQASSDRKKHMLIYNKSRTVTREREASPEVIKAIKGRSKAFFNIRDTPDGFVIESEADWQD